MVYELAFFFRDAEYGFRELEESCFDAAKIVFGLAKSFRELAKIVHELLKEFRDDANFFRGILKIFRTSRKFSAIEPANFVT